MDNLFAAAVDEEALVNQLRLQNLHLESSLQLANAQISVNKLDLQSVQRAYDDAMVQLVNKESESMAKSKPENYQYNQNQDHDSDSQVVHYWQSAMVQAQY